MPFGTGRIGPVSGAPPPAGTSLGSGKGGKSWVSVSLNWKEQKDEKMFLVNLHGSKLTIM
jgi:hypothetical protein